MKSITIAVIIKDKEDFKNHIEKKIKNNEVVPIRTALGSAILLFGNTEKNYFPVYENNESLFTGRTIHDFEIAKNATDNPEFDKILELTKQNFCLGLMSLSRLKLKGKPIEKATWFDTPFRESLRVVMDHHKYDAVIVAVQETGLRLKNICLPHQIYHDKLKKYLAESDLPDGIVLIPVKTKDFININKEIILKKQEE